jgi:DNA-binding NarL/FixJ family response regulator
LRLAATACHLTLAGCVSDGEIPSRPRTRQSGRQTLTCRELEVLRLIASGLRDRQIADALFVNRSTVASHVTAILNKLSVESRAAAVASAIRRGMI